MHINYGGWDEFIYKQKEKNVVCFGAGMMPYYIEGLLGEWNVIDNIICFLDNDKNKQGTNIDYGEKKIPIVSIEAFLLTNNTNVIILITSEAFIPILQQLSAVEGFNNMECFIYPYINKSYFDKYVRQHRIKEDNIPDENQYIPKVIHYCWFGKNKLGPMEEYCIDSWRKHCPDYKIIRWDESNYDVTKTKYMKQAYDEKKWAFVTDYARLDILYTYGGLYFDTDVELIKNIDMLLINRGFIAYGEWPAVNSGAGIGAEKGNKVIKEMRDIPRLHMPFLNDKGGVNLTTNSIFESKILSKYGLKQNFKNQVVNGIRVFPPDIFAPESIIGDGAYITEHTLAIHHCRGSWASNQRQKDMEETILKVEEGLTNEYFNEQ